MTISGVPLFSGTSELNYDFRLPSSPGKPIGVDLCLGNNDYAPFYHYYSYSPCILN